MVALLVGPLPAAPDIVRADDPPIRDDCFVGKGPGVAPDGSPCSPANPRHTKAEEALIAAKTRKAKAYELYKAGKISKAEFDRAANAFWALSAERPIEPAVNRISRAIGQDPTFRTSPGQPSLSGQLANFWPFEQYYDWQCGPATAQSILWYKGPHTSQYAPDGSTITGSRQNDQWYLGYSYYTNANSVGQTPWNPQVVDLTLNRWRTGFDTGFYITGSVSSSGGDVNNLGQSDVMTRFEDDIDFDYPVAENVEYGSNSYRPSAFPGPANWQHWDTVYGYYDAGGVRYVQIGQVWGSTRFYDVA